MACLAVIGQYFLRFTRRCVPLFFGVFQSISAKIVQKRSVCTYLFALIVLENRATSSIG